MATAEDTPRRRGYDQYCAIATALDVVGERWTLLVVRDLFLGPKRYTDLREGLPGIATDLLTARLRRLEEAGLVVTERRGRSKFHYFDGTPLSAIAERWPTARKDAP